MFFEVAVTQRTEGNVGLFAHVKEFAFPYGRFALPSGLLPRGVTCLFTLRYLHNGTGEVVRVPSPTDKNADSTNANFLRGAQAYPPACSSLFAGSLHVLAGGVSAR